MPNVVSREPMLFTRNSFFASKNYFTGNKLSRRDDIIQIVYNLLYLTNPSNFEMKDLFLAANDQFYVMGKFKAEKTPEQICIDPRA